MDGVMRQTPHQSIATLRGGTHGTPRAKHFFFVLHQSAPQHPMEFVSPEGLRMDGRRPKELRRLSCQIDVLDSADGSAIFEMGNTKVIHAHDACAVPQLPTSAAMRCWRTEPLNNAGPLICHCDLHGRFWLQFLAQGKSTREEKGKKTER